MVKWKKKQDLHEQNKKDIVTDNGHNELPQLQLF